MIPIHMLLGVRGLYPHGNDNAVFACHKVVNKVVTRLLQPCNNIVFETVNRLVTS